MVAAALVTAWLANGRGTITTLEQQSAVLRQRLAARSSTSTDDAASARPAAPAKAVAGKEPIDWKAFAAQMQEMRNGGGMGDMRSMIRIQQRLQAMTRDELASALDEIAALDLPEESRTMIAQMLIGPLCQKDPEFALNRYIDRINDERGGFGWQLPNAIKEWADKDPAAATAWLDRQIADGKFESKSLDGKSQPRMQFEGNLIGALLSTNPDAAAGRLEAFPEDQRKELLQRWTGNTVKEENQLAFATLVRKELEANEQLDTLADLAALRSWQEGFENTDAYLDRIEATPAERAATIEKVAENKVRNFMRAKKVTREDIDSLREWAATQAPDAVDGMTGRALAMAGQNNNGLDFSEASAMALEYRESTGNDEVLVSFLDRGIRSEDKESARALAEKISDPARRAEVLEKLK